MNNKALFIAAAMAVSGMGVIGCEGEVETDSNSTGARVEVDKDKVEQATDRAGDALAKAGEKAREVGGELAQGARVATERTGDAISNAADRLDNTIGDGENGHAGRVDGSEDVNQDNAQLAADRAPAANNDADAGQTDRDGPVTSTINRIDNAAGADTNSPGHAGATVDQRDVEDSNRAADRGMNTADRTTEQDMTRGTIAPNGTAHAPDAEAIRDMFASATEAFVRKGTFDDLVERFVDADRNRIGANGFAESSMGDLDARADSFLNHWQSKYGEEFDIKNEELVFNNLRIQQSEIGQTPRTAGGVDAGLNVRSADNADVSVDNQTGVDSPANQAADSNRNDPGRNIANVTLPASHGMPEVSVGLIHEFPDV